MSAQKIINQKNKIKNRYAQLEQYEKKIAKLVLEKANLMNSILKLEAELDDYTKKAKKK